jgi:hypothetical protein
LKKHIITLVLTAAMAAALPAFADVSHLGFTINDQLLSAADKARLEPDMSKSLREQIDIIDAARLPADVLAGLKAITIVLDPALTSQPGIFTGRNGGEVRLQPAIFTRKRPVLLHELLHAYHFYTLTLQNKDVTAAFEMARNDPDFAKFRRAHFLQNAKEFFAVTASIYLSGDVQQPPFTCAAFAGKYPAYMQFLEGQFGKRPCQSM